MRNCSLDINANSLNLTQTDQCICNNNYVWDVFAGLCVRNCSAINYTVTYNPLNIS
jgi:hypothetical protein